MTISVTPDDHLARILDHRQPFGPPDTESVVSAGCACIDRLFDTSNLIYAQAVGAARPAYIIGRKGAGKTAFLLSTAGPGRQPELLRTATERNVSMTLRQPTSGFRLGRYLFSGVG